jgi:hypothetical protein
MNEPATDRTTARAPAPLDVLALRAWARAYLWSIGEYTLQEAVDVLQHDAERDGLLDELGEDGVQQVIADAFAPFREGEHD